MAKAILKTGKTAFTVMVPVVIAALCIYGWEAVRTAHAQDEVIQPPPGPVVENQTKRKSSAPVMRIPGYGKLPQSRK